MEYLKAKTLGEFILLLKQDHGDSYASLSEKVGVGGTTLQRLAKGRPADDSTLDALAQYASVPREWLYELAKNLNSRPRYSRVATLVASLVDQMPTDYQEAFLAQAKAVVENRKKRERNTESHANGIS